MSSRTLALTAGTPTEMSDARYQNLLARLDAALVELEWGTDIVPAIVGAPTTASTQTAGVVGFARRVNEAAGSVFIGDTAGALGLADDLLGRCMAAYADGVNVVGPPSELLNAELINTNFAIGDYLSLCNEDFAGFDQVWGSISATAADRITVWPVCLNAAGDDVWVNKLNPVAAVHGTDITLVAPFVTSGGPTRANFDVGDYVAVFNEVTHATVLRHVSAVSATTITLNAVVGTTATDDTLTAKLNKSRPRVAAVGGAGVFTTIVSADPKFGPDIFTIGDLISVFNATTGTSYLTAVRSIGVTGTGTIVAAAAVGAAVGQVLYVSKLTVQPGYAGTDITVGPPSVITGAANNTQFTLGNPVHVYNVTANTHAQTVLSVVSGAGDVTTHDSVGAVVTDDTLVFHWGWRENFVVLNDGLWYTLVAYLDPAGVIRLKWIAGQRAAAASAVVRSADYISGYLGTTNWRIIGSTLLDRSADGAVTQTYNNAACRTMPS